MGYSVVTVSVEFPTSPVELAACLLGVGARGVDLGAAFATPGVLAPRLLVLHTTTGNATRHCLHEAPVAQHSVWCCWMLATSLVFWGLATRYVSVIILT